MNDNYLDNIARSLSNIDLKKNRFEEIKKSINEMKSLIESIENVYETAPAEHIQKKLIDLTYKQSNVLDFILSFDEIDMDIVLDAKEIITKNNFEFVFIDHEKIKIKTPFPPIKIGGARTKLSQIYAKKISDLLHKNIKESGIKMPLFSSADVIFNIYIGNDIDTKNIPDADNLDLKSILDALQIYIVPDDNLLTITYKICGFRIEGDGYMEIVIRDTSSDDF